MKERSICPKTLSGKHHFEIRYFTHGEGKDGSCCIYCEIIDDTGKSLT